MSFDIRSYGGADPDNMTALTATLRLQEAYGWPGSDIRKWAAYLPYRKDFPYLMIDPYFLAALIRLLEGGDKEPRPPEPKKREEVGRASGDPWGDNQQAGLNKAMVARWKAIHAVRLAPAGAGNNLGVTAMTVMRLLERDGISMKHLRQLMGWGERTEELTSVMQGRKRVSQRMAEQIAAKIDPIEADNHPTPSMPDENEPPPITTKMQKIPWVEVVNFCDWYEIPRSSEAIHMRIWDEDFPESAARGAMGQRTIEPKAFDAWRRAYAPVIEGMALNERRRLAEQSQQG